MRAQADLSDKVVADTIDSAILMEAHPAVLASDFVLAFGRHEGFQGDRGD